jgi:hypothetical protein
VEDGDQKKTYSVTEASTGRLLARAKRNSDRSVGGDSLEGSESAVKARETKHSAPPSIVDTTVAREVSVGQGRENRAEKE